MRAVAVIQARVGSRRLPGKVLADLCGAPLLVRMVERVRRTPGLAEVAIATTDRPGDGEVRALARDIGAPCFAGAADDVLTRYHDAAAAFAADPVVRLTGDCPLIDPEVIAAVLDCYATSARTDCAGLGGPFPDGLDTEVVRREALAAAWREARLPSEREHVTPYIWKHPERFRLVTYRFPEDHCGQRWTVDEPADLAFVRAVYGRLYRPHRAFGWREVVALLDAEPALRAINAHIARNAGYARSLEEDRGGASSGDGA